MTPTAEAAKFPRVPTTLQAVLRAVIAWAILCVAVGLSISLAQLTGDLFATSQAVVAAQQALLVSCFVVPAIVFLRRRLDGQSLDGIGVSRGWPKAALLGTAVGLGTGVLTWTPAFVAGWIRLDQLDPVALLSFLAVNTIVVLLYEALPEELALRGYGWSTIRDSWTAWAATLVITVLFCFSSTLISLVQSGSAVVLGVEGSGVSLAPGGGDPIAYFVQIVLFGLALIAARRIPLPGALTAAIAFHVTQLTVTRALLGGLGWIDSGVETTFVAPDAIALVLAHIALGGLIFVVLRRRLETRSTDDLIDEQPTSPLSGL